MTFHEELVKILGQIKIVRLIIIWMNVMPRHTYLTASLNSEKDSSNDIDIRSLKMT